MGQHAEEVLKSIKTVVAFGGEDKEMQRYSKNNVPINTRSKIKVLILDIKTNKFCSSTCKKSRM